MVFDTPSLWNDNPPNFYIQVGKGDFQNHDVRVLLKVHEKNLNVVSISSSCIVGFIYSKKSINECVKGCALVMYIPEV